MGNLLNAEVIKAAASSNLGMLSLMCLILGVIVMGFFKKAPVKVRIIIFILLFIGVAGFGYAIMHEQSPHSIPEATREFAVGRWQVEQKSDLFETGSYIDYFEDGTFSGRQETLVKERGLFDRISGSWSFKTLTKDQFQMTLNFNNGKQWQAKFRILGYERIHNIDENYDAVRVPK
jgi:hypothetical protein